MSEDSGGRALPTNILVRRGKLAGMAQADDLHVSRKPATLPPSQGNNPMRIATTGLCRDNELSHRKWFGVRIAYTVMKVSNAPRLLQPKRTPLGCLSRHAVTAPRRPSDLGVRR